MYQIRYGVFESNSSSTHSLCICTDEEYDKFVRGELGYNWIHNKLEPIAPIPQRVINEAIDHYKYTRNEYQKDWEDLSKEAQDRYISRYVREESDYDRDDDAMSYDEFTDSELEYYANHFTTPSGDKMVAFGRYGFDG